MGEEGKSRFCHGLLRCRLNYWCLSDVIYRELYFGASAMTWRLLAAAALLTGCVSTSIPQEAQAVRDYVVVSDLESVRFVRLYRQLRYGYVNDYFVTVAAGKRHYLVEFASRCRALRSKDFIAAMVDHRYDPAYLHVGDTIKGCPVGTIFEATAEQLLEVKELSRSQASGAIVPPEEETQDGEEDPSGP